MSSTSLNPRSDLNIRGTALLVCFLTAGFWLLLMPGPSLAGEPLLSDPIILSEIPDTGIDGNAAAKSRLVRLTYSTPQGFVDSLVAVYADGVGPIVWSFDDSLHAAADVFVTRSLDDGVTWTQPINLSNAANLSSIDCDDDGDVATPPVPYAGDAEKPNLVASGKRLLLTWASRYCPSGVQRTVRYPEAADIEVPYGCLWSARSSDGGVTWLPAQRLTDAFRDAKQDVPRGNGVGFAIVLQQDPKGLQPGDAEGPGDGGSGAKVSQGTDIWFSSLKVAPFDAGTPFSEAQRLTDNFTRFDNDGFESGSSGSSRANFFLSGGNAVVAYEETKGVEGLVGKVVRYHVFSAFDASLPDWTAGAGCIVSQIAENARRTRFVLQSDAFAASSGLRWILFWRQGLDGQGGPADVVARFGRIDTGDPASTGWRPEDLWPPVVSGCTDSALAAGNAQPLNLSSVEGLAATTDANSVEDARAHRALVRGDSIVMGWAYTPQSPLSTELASYDFFVRTSMDAGATWSASRNLSNLTDPRVSVVEPRLVGTPPSTLPGDLASSDVVIAAWGTEYNTLFPQRITMPLNIALTRSVDSGVTWGSVVPIADGPAAQSEAQLVIDPEGFRLYGIWQEEEADPAKIDAMFRSVTFIDLFADGFESGDTTKWNLTLP